MFIVFYLELRIMVKFGNKFYDYVINKKYNNKMCYIGILVKLWYFVFYFNIRSLI